MKYILPLLFCIQFQFAIAQNDTLTITLPDLIELAQSDAPDVFLAKTRLNNNYWNYQSFLASYKPQIDFNATLPNLDRSISSITLPDGSDDFINRSLMRNALGVTMSQGIAQTGGRIFANAGIQRLDIFKTVGSNGFTSYLSTPIRIGFEQPLFGFNQLKWDKKTEPLRFQQATKEYAEDMENVALNTAVLFFDLYVAQLNISAQEKRKSNADALYETSKGRFEVGRIAETELLQIELTVNNAEASLASAILNLQTSTERLRIFLGMETPINFMLIPPSDIPDFNIDLDAALEQAIQNTSQSVRLQRQLLEAEGDLINAEKQAGVSMNIFGVFGLSQTGNTLGDALRNPLDQEQLTLGIQVPIADWGRSEASIKIAESNRELTRRLAEQEAINFKQDIVLRVKQFDLLRNQVNLALKAYEVALKRQDITKKRYLIGKIGITELNLAIREEDESRVKYINALRAFWVAYYELRSLCLYDFENNVSLVKKLDIE